MIESYLTSFQNIVSEYNQIFTSIKLFKRNMSTDFVIVISDKINTILNYFFCRIKHATIPKLHRNCKEIRHIGL